MCQVRLRLTRIAMHGCPVASIDAAIDGTRRAIDGADLIGRGIGPARIPPLVRHVRVRLNEGGRSECLRPLAGDDLVVLLAVAQSRVILEVYVRYPRVVVLVTARVEAF